MKYPLNVKNWEIVKETGKYKKDIPGVDEKIRRDSKNDFTFLYGWKHWKQRNEIFVKKKLRNNVIKLKFEPLNTRRNDQNNDKIKIMKTSE